MLKIDELGQAQTDLYFGVEGITTYRAHMQRTTQDFMTTWILVRVKQKLLMCGAKIVLSRSSIVNVAPYMDSCVILKGATVFINGT